MENIVNYYKKKIIERVKEIGVYERNNAREELNK